MSSKFSKYQIATFIAILFHSIGAVGILFFNRPFFINTTPLNLLLSLVLLVWTQSEKNIAFWFFLAATIFIGIVAEMIGVNTGYLFGDYSYTNSLGPALMRTPLVIGVNWFIVIYTCGISMHIFLQNMISKLPPEANRSPKRLRVISIILDGATLALLLDLLIEPVAIKLGLWKWGGDGTVPFFNYLSWFFVSALLLTIFQFCNFNKLNKFAVNLLLIQAMFFLILRTFLK